MDKLKSVSFEANNLLLNNPLWIVDVGASGGIHPRWRNLTSCLKCILFEPDLKPTLKKEKLTTRDSRAVERKKYGHRKARRSFQFSKR